MIISIVLLFFNLLGISLRNELITYIAWINLFAIPFESAIPFWLKIMVTNHWIGFVAYYYEERNVSEYARNWIIVNIALIVIDCYIIRLSKLERFAQMIAFLFFFIMVVLPMSSN